MNYKGENFRRITMVPNGERGYSLKTKGRVQALERRWKRLRKVAVGNVKGAQHEQVQK